MFPWACDHCGEGQGTALKCCSRCKDSQYCGAECQKAAWKGHKKKCEPPSALRRTLGEFLLRLKLAHTENNWQGLLKSEGRVEELMEGRSDAGCLWILGVFEWGHGMGLKSTGNSEHALLAIGLGKRRVELWGKMKRFRDQGTQMCSIAQDLTFLRKDGEADAYFQAARDLGSKHGFFSVECESCIGDPTP